MALEFLPVKHLVGVVGALVEEEEEGATRGEIVGVDGGALADALKGDASKRLALGDREPMLLGNSGPSTRRFPPLLEERWMLVEGRDDVPDGAAPSPSPPVDDAAELEEEGLSIEPDEEEIVVVLDTFV